MYSLDSAVRRCSYWGMLALIAKALSPSDRDLVKNAYG
jgi:hypothetical protein